VGPGNAHCGGCGGEYKEAEIQFHRNHFNLELSQQSEPQLSEPSGLSQHENQILPEEPDSQSSHVDLQQITPDTSTQAEKPASKKKKKKEKV
jgi:hypothetical protein